MRPARSICCGPHGPHPRPARWGLAGRDPARRRVFRSMDEGRSWHARQRRPPAPRRRAWRSPISPATRRAWYALHPFGVSESLDEGLRWRHAAAGLPPHRAPSVLAALGDALYAEVEGFGSIASIRRMQRGGSQGSRPRPPPPRGAGRAMRCTPCSRMDGPLGRSPDAGRSWASVQRGLPADGLVTACRRHPPRRPRRTRRRGGAVWRTPMRPDLYPDAHPARRKTPASKATLQANQPQPVRPHHGPIPFALSAEAARRPHRARRARRRGRAARRRGVPGGRAPRWSSKRARSRPGFTTPGLLRRTGTATTARCCCSDSAAPNSYDRTHEPEANMIASGSEGEREDVDPPSPLRMRGRPTTVRPRCPTVSPRR